MTTGPARVSLTLLALLAAAGAANQTRPPICAIDMGSNSFKRIVGTFESGRYEQRHFERKTLGVGDDLARHGRISDAKLVDIEKALAEFKAACASDGAAPVLAVGTAAFREAPNGARVVEIAARLGIPMEIATERRESELAYLVGSLGQDGYAVVDNGSRSIELVAKGSALDYRVFNLGYRIAYDKFFVDAVDPRAASTAMRGQLLQETADVPFMRGRKKLIGVEFAEMVDVLFEPAEIEGRVLTLDALQRKLQEISTSGPQIFQQLKTKKDIDRALPRL